MEFKISEGADRTFQRSRAEHSSQALSS